MYVIVREIFLWPHVGKDVYQTAWNNATWVWNSERAEQNQHLQIFLTPGPFAFTAMGTLFPLSQTTTLTVFVLVMTARFKKMTSDIFLTDVTATYYANVILDHCIVTCGTGHCLTMENGGQFVSKTSEIFFGRLVLKPWQWWVTFPRTIGKMKLIMETIITLLRYHVAQTQD